MPEVMVLPELTATPIAGSDPALAEALAAAHLPTEDLADPGRYFFVFSDASGAICGFGGYELPGGHALIRSMVVPETARGRGLGSAILAALRDAVATGKRLRAVSQCEAGGLAPGAYAAGAALWAAGVENGGKETPEAALIRLWLS